MVQSLMWLLVDKVCAKSVEFSIALPRLFYEFPMRTAELFLILSDLVLDNNVTEDAHIMRCIDHFYFNNFFLGHEVT